MRARGVRRSLGFAAWSEGARAPSSNQPLLRAGGASDRIAPFRMWFDWSNENGNESTGPKERQPGRSTLAASPPHMRGIEMDDVLRQAEALLRFSGEVENRMAESGLGGVTGVIERYVQLRQALDRLSQRELDWAKGEVDRLIATLTAVADQLEQLRAIKLAIVDPN